MLGGVYRGSASNVEAFLRRILHVNVVELGSLIDRLAEHADIRFGLVGVARVRA